MFSYFLQSFFEENSENQLPFRGVLKVLEPKKTKIWSLNRVVWMKGTVWNFAVVEVKTADKKIATFW